MASSGIEKLMPGQAEMERMGDVAEIMTWAGLKPEDWAKVIMAMGEEELNLLPVIAAIENEAYVDAMANAHMGVVAKTKINLVVNVARVKAGLPLDSLTGKGAKGPGATDTGGATPPAPVFPPVMPPEMLTAIQAMASLAGAKTNGLKVNQYFDQASRTEVQPIPEDEIVKMRDRWEDAKGMEPAEHLDLSDNQIWSVRNL